MGSLVVISKLPAIAVVRDPLLFLPIK